MSFIESLRQKIGMSPIDNSLEQSLRRAKERSEAEHLANQEEARRGQEELDRQEEKLWQERKDAVDKRGMETTRLYSPILKTIKKTYLGPFRGEIILHKDYEHEKVTLELKWDEQIGEERVGSIYAGGSRLVQTFEGEHFYFEVDKDGETKFGPMHKDDSTFIYTTESFGMIKISPGNNDWKDGLAEKIQRSIDSGACHYSK